MKIAIGLIALLVAGTAYADELADANKLIEAKSYPQALALYTRLANAGNAEAQFHLGEMYWYGEAGRVDLPVAEGWFKKAAAAGNKEAGAALATMRARETRAADIAFWTGTYDGADLKSGKFACAQPAIPAISKDNKEIKAVNASVASWQACYNGVVQNLQDAMPPGKRIPPDIAKLMNQIEYDQAVERMDKVYASVAAETGKEAQAILAQRDAWYKATNEFIVGANKKNKMESDINTQRHAEDIARVILTTKAILPEHR
jgi:TPR repeat protein